MRWGGRLEAGIRTHCVDEKSLTGIFRKVLDVGNTHLETNRAR